MIDFKNSTYLKLTKVSPDAAKDITPLLVNGESIAFVYKTVRDYVAFTNKRIVAVNVQGITGKKKDYTTLPYSKIQAFSIETAGLLDLDSELDIWFSGLGHVKFEFSGMSDIAAIGRFISDAIL